MKMWERPKFKTFFVKKGLNKGDFRQEIIAQMDSLFISDIQL
jgi:hypothetical protein